MDTPQILALLYLSLMPEGADRLRQAGKRLKTRASCTTATLGYSGRLAGATGPGVDGESSLIRIETNIRECRELWETFSPGQDAWDDWDLMFAFHDQDKHLFHFLVHEADDGSANGLVPLVNDTSQGRFMLMGGSYPDGRVLWMQYDDFPDFFDGMWWYRGK